MPTLLIIYETRIGTYDKQLEDDIHVLFEEITQDQVIELKHIIDKELYSMNEEDEEWNEWDIGVLVRDYANEHNLVEIDMENESIRILNR